MSLCLFGCDVAAHFDLITCHLLVSFFHDLIWITLLIFHLFFHDLIWFAMACILFPWLDMDYFVIFHLFFHDLIWIVLPLYSFIFPHDMIWIVITFLFLPWLDMAYFVNLFLLSPWLDIDLSFFHLFSLCGQHVPHRISLAHSWLILN